MADQKYLSVLMKRFLQPYILTEYQKFSLFIQKYFEYADLNGNIANEIFNFLSIIDIDKVENEEILEKYLNQYFSGFPSYRSKDIDIKKIIKNARDFYSIKGTEQSYNFIFKILNHAGVFSFYYPSKDIFTLSDSVNGVISGKNKIHDNFYYAHYVYEIRSSLYGYNELKDIVENLLHPVGSKVFFLRIIQSGAELENGDGSESYLSFYYDNNINCNEYGLSNKNVYKNNEITFSDIEDINPEVLLSTFKLSEMDDTFYNLENNNTLDYYPYQLPCQTTLL